MNNIAEWLFSDTLFLVLGIMGLSLFLNIFWGHAHLATWVVATYIGVAIVEIVPISWLKFSHMGPTILLLVLIFLIGLQGNKLYWGADEWGVGRFSWRFIIFAFAGIGMMVSV